eukprot:gene32630-17643_t
MEPADVWKTGRTQSSGGYQAASPTNPHFPRTSSCGEHSSYTLVSSPTHPYIPRSSSRGVRSLGRLSHSGGGATGGPATPPASPYIPRSSLPGGGGLSPYGRSESLPEPDHSMSQDQVAAEAATYPNLISLTHGASTDGRVRSRLGSPSASSRLPNGANGATRSAELDAELACLFDSGGKRPEEQILLPLPLNPKIKRRALAMTISVNGWATTPQDYILPWRNLPSKGSHSGSKSASVWSSFAMTAGSAWAAAAKPAQVAGCRLAAVLAAGGNYGRPVTLIGFGMGAKVIFQALVELHRLQKRSLVETVVLMGAPVNLNAAEWSKARSVVAGRFINAYSRKDWVLALVHRYHSKGAIIKSIAGLAPVNVPGIENLNLSRTLRKKGRKAAAKAKPTGPPKKRGRPRKEPTADDDEGPKKSIKGKKLKKKKKQI